MSDFPYKLIRSHRRTLTLTVNTGQVIVKAPYGLPDEAIRRFIEEKRRWLESKIAEQKISAGRFAPVLAGNCLLDAGVIKAVHYGALKNIEGESSFYLKNECAVRVFFEKTRGWILFELVHDFSRRMGVTPSGVSLCDFKARWGSCDDGGRIKLNWRLLMLPDELRDYVIIHELSHLHELNHSAAFWRIVEKYCPQYHKYRKSLRDFSFLTRMYRRGKEIQ